MENLDKNQFSDTNERLENKPVQESESVSAFDLYKEKYLPARRNSRSDSSASGARLEIKSEIADKISRGDKTLDDHFVKLRAKINERGNETADQFAARISDGIKTTKKREPSLLETTTQTKRFDEAYRSIVESLGDLGKRVYRIGSSFWGRNYSIRGNEHKDQSDIDLEVIVDEDEVNFPLWEVSQAYAKFYEYYKKGEADFCAVKQTVDGIDVSFHFAPKNVFVKICEFDYVHAGTPTFLREFRAGTQISPKTYLQKNFAGDQYAFKTTPVAVEGGQISQVPLVMIGDHDELVMGVILNKYLPLPENIENDKEIFQCMKKLVDTLRRRMNDDRKRLLGKELSFAHFHAHSENMPLWIKKKLESLDLE